MKRILVTLFLLSGFTPIAIADWAYRTDPDRMSGKVSRIASLESSNSLNLDFPYKGKNHGGLTIFFAERNKSPRVLLSIEKGQFICRSRDACAVMVKFDGTPAIRFSATESADHDSRYLFIDNERKFIAMASKSRQILIEALIYKAGMPLLEFNSKSELKSDVKVGK